MKFQRQAPEQRLSRASWMSSWKLVNGCLPRLTWHGSSSSNLVVGPLPTLDSLNSNLASAGMQNPGATLIAILGATIVLILTAGQGPLRFIALGFKAAIAVALDVVAWLRVRPETQNPKRQICARFVSLLRHICSEHTAGASYRGIVMVAHSQGTVIMTDLLRFLSFQFGGPQYDKALEPLRSEIPVYLMTFGNPLR
jgi:hypothetical protein